MRALQSLYQFIMSEIRSPKAKHGLITLIDQGLVSGVTFVTSILLARLLSPIEFGIFVLAYAVLLFANTVQVAIVVNPMMIFNSHLEGGKLRLYLSSTALFQFFLGILIASLIFTASITSSIWLPGHSIKQICPVLAFAIFSFQYQEFFRRMLFARMHFKKALLNDSITYGLQVLGIILVATQNNLSAITSFTIIGISFSIGTLVGFFQCRQLLILNLSSFSCTVKRNWSHGKWLLSSNLAFWISGQSYFFITAYFVGPIGPAVLKACQNIVAPSHVILHSLENLVPSTASKKFTSFGVTALTGFLSRTRNAVLALIIPYFLIACLMSEKLLKVLYNDQYKGFGIIVIMIAIQYLISSLNRTLMIGLRVLNKPKKVFTACATAGFATIAASIPLVLLFGIKGAALGTIIATGVMFTVLRYNFAKETSKDYS